MPTQTASPPVLVARALADELLAPAAEEVDRTRVRRAVVDRLAAAGLLGLTGPAAYGGGAAPAAVQREVTEVLAGACGATWFVTTQHAMPLATLAASGNEGLRDRLLRPMCSGGALSGVAVAHVRRPGPPPVTATRVDGGWRFDGTVAWMTSWGLCDVFLLGGTSPEGEVVLVLLPAREGPGLRATPPMRLLAMQASSTVALDLDGLLVPDADVARVAAAEEWLAADRAKTANVTPAVFGLHATVVRRLRETAERRSDTTAARLADTLAAEGTDLRDHAYALIDDVPDTERLDERLRLRAAALELVLRAATALVVATGGSAMSLDAAPQRLLREAGFFLVQAQTPAVREATLRRLQGRAA